MSPTPISSRAEIRITGYLPATRNHKDEAELAAAAAAAIGLPVRRDLRPTMGAEDFGRFLKPFPAPMPGSATAPRPACTTRL